MFAASPHWRHAPIPRVHITGRGGGIDGDVLGVWSGDALKEVDLATWRGISRSVWRSRGIWWPSMVWLRRCGGCRTSVSVYICYTWWGSRSSLTRASGLWMLSTWGTLETLVLLLVIHGELRHYLTCIGSSTMLHVGTAVRWQDT